MKKKSKKLSKTVLRNAFQYAYTAKYMAQYYEQNFKFVSKYVHATSRGHEAIQVALGMQLLPRDYLSAYYRDDAMLLSIGLEPYELMLQLMAKKDDPFSGGRAYYTHPSLKDPGKPLIPHQSSATGMQAIPTTGIALGLRYKETQNLITPDEKGAVVVCSLGDGSMTEGEVSEALQMSILKKLPILYLVQDNDWDISAYKDEVRGMNAYQYAQGFPGLDSYQVNGNDFIESYQLIRKVLSYIRRKRRPVLVHAKVPLLNHHTSGVRMEWYRDDLTVHQEKDPIPILEENLLEWGFDEEEINELKLSCQNKVIKAFEKAQAAEDPLPSDLYTSDFAPTPIRSESGNRIGPGEQPAVMVDCALHAIDELMQKHPECLLYGQDVGRRLGGVFREAATLAEKYGDERVFNTPIQEAFIIGSTVGMSAVGLKPIVEVQFADYIWPGLNQLFTEVSRSCYLSNGKWPVSAIIRVPTGAYGGGGPYHSSSVESVVTNIKGIKIAYPSNGSDLKGLLKAAFYDPNPVVIFEHKGLYWSKVPHTESAKVIEPDADYILPFGKGRLVISADDRQYVANQTVLIITYGIGVHWSLQAAEEFPGQITILDLRTLYPLDESLILESCKRHNRVLILTEEPKNQSFSQALAGRIQQECFQWLDAPILVIGSKNVPAVPLNLELEKEYLPSLTEISKGISYLLHY